MTGAGRHTTCRCIALECNASGALFPVAPSWSWTPGPPIPARHCGR